MRVPLPRLAQLPRLASLRADAMAGFTVAMVGAPQCMAYAAVAGVAPLFGLYTGIIPTMLGSLFGSSRFLVTGPSNATALVTANVLQPLAGQDGYLQAVFALALLSGAIKLGLGLLKLGWIIRYVSNHVLIGFLTGASILIVLGQLYSFLGLPPGPRSNAPDMVLGTVGRLSSLNLYVLAVGLLTMGILLAVKRINGRLPAELIAVVVASAFVAVANWASHGVRLVGDMTAYGAASISFHVPQLPLQEWRSLVPSAVAVAIFSLVEAVSIAKAVGQSGGERLDASREFIGQGTASLVGGFFQCIPSSGSPSRTAVNYSTGAQTRLAGVFAGLIVLLGLLAFAPLLARIPYASLSGVIIITAFNLVDRRQVRATWQGQIMGRVVYLATLAATLLLPLHIAIYVGVLLSIIIYVVESSKLELSYLSRSPSGGFVEHSFEDLLSNPPAIAIINIEGSLSFGAAEDLEQRLDQITDAGIRVVILRLRRLHILSTTGVSALVRIVTHANRAGTRVLMCGVKGDVETSLQASGLEDIMDPEDIFKASDVLFDSTQQALARAEELVVAERTHGD